MVAFFAPVAAQQTCGFKVIQRREFVQRPVGVDGSGALEVGPKHDLGFRRAEQACLCTGAEAVVVDFGGELLCTFQGVAKGGFAALVARKGQVGAGGT